MLSSAQKKVFFIFFNKYSQNKPHLFYFFFTFSTFFRQDLSMTPNSAKDQLEEDLKRSSGSEIVFYLSFKELR